LANKETNQQKHKHEVPLQASTYDKFNGTASSQLKSS